MARKPVLWHRVWSSYWMCNKTGHPISYLGHWNILGHRKNSSGNSFEKEHGFTLILKMTAVYLVRTGTYFKALNQTSLELQPLVISRVASWSSCVSSPPRPTGSCRSSSCWSCWSCRGQTGWRQRSGAPGTRRGRPANAWWSCWRSLERFFLDEIIFLSLFERRDCYLGGHFGERCSLVV